MRQNSTISERGKKANGACRDNQPCRKKVRPTRSFLNKANAFLASSPDTYLGIILGRRAATSYHSKGWPRSSHTNVRYHVAFHSFGGVPFPTTNSYPGSVGPGSLSKTWGIKPFLDGNHFLLKTLGFLHGAVEKASAVLLEESLKLFLIMSCHHHHKHGYSVRDLCSHHHCQCLNGRFRLQAKWQVLRPLNNHRKMSKSLPLALRSLGLSLFLSKSRLKLSLSFFFP